MDVAPYLLRAARSLLGMSQDELAGFADISRRSLAKIESGDRTILLANYDAVRRVLEGRGIEFIPGTERCGPGLRISIGLASKLSVPDRHVSDSKGLSR